MPLPNWISLMDSVKEAIFKVAAEFLTRLKCLDLRSLIHSRFSIRRVTRDANLSLGCKKVHLRIWTKETQEVETGKKW